MVYGDAWVSGDARVYGDAWVSGKARVSGDARVYGDAWVSGNALVYGDAWVSGDARVYGDAWVSQRRAIFWVSCVGSADGTLTAYATKDGTIEITRGCFRGTVDEFLAASERKHDDDTHIEYRLLVEVACSRIGRAQQ